MGGKRPSEKLCAAFVLSCGGRLHGKALVRMCYENLQDMMCDRGYTVTDACATDTEIMARIDATRPVLCAHKEGCKPICCYIDADERSGVKFVRALRDEATALLIASVEGATPF